MNPITWLLAGAVLGWLTSIVIRRRRSALWLNIIAGMVGAFLAGYLIYPMFHITIINPQAFNLPALLVALVGAVLFLAAANFMRRENNVKNAEIEGHWELVRNKIHTRWDKLTEEDIEKINGDHNQFIETLQTRYGCNKKEAEDQIQRYLKSFPGIT